MANNPYNKDVKYNTLLEYWKTQLGLQDDMLKEVEDELKTLEVTRTNLITEERTLSDKSCARAIELRNFLKQPDPHKKVLENNIQLILAGKSAILTEMSRLSIKQDKSAKKTAEKWVLAKMEGKNVTPYKPTEGKLKPRLLLPAVVTVANYLTR